MIDPKDIHKMDQASEAVCEHLPPMLHAFGRSCSAAGFNDEHAFDLVKMYYQSLIDISNATIAQN